MIFHELYQQFFGLKNNFKKLDLNKIIHINDKYYR